MIDFRIRRGEIALLRRDLVLVPRFRADFDQSALRRGLCGIHHSSFVAMRAEEAIVDYMHFPEGSNIFLDNIYRFLSRRNFALELLSKKATKAGKNVLRSAIAVEGRHLTVEKLRSHRNEIVSDIFSTNTSSIIGDVLHKKGDEIVEEVVRYQIYDIVGP